MTSLQVTFVSASESSMRELQEALQATTLANACQWCWLDVNSGHERLGAAGLVLVVRGALASSAQQDEHFLMRMRELGVACSVLNAASPDWLAQAVAVVSHAHAVAQARRLGHKPRPWRWVCEKCDDGECERHWLPGGAA